MKMIFFFLHQIVHCFLPYQNKKKKFEKAENIQKNSFSIIYESDFFVLIPERSLIFTTPNQKIKV